MTIIKNMTAHPVTVITEDEDGTITSQVTYEPSGESVTISTHEHESRIGIGAVGNVWTDVADIEYRGLSVDLPRGGFGLHYIVPLQVALAERRRDFLVPIDYVYDDDGQKIGVRTLGRIM